MRRTIQAAVAVSCVALSAAAPPFGPGSAAFAQSSRERDRAVPLDAWIAQEADAALRDAVESRDFAAARRRVARAHDVGLAFVRDRDLESLVPAERARRLLTAMEPLDDDRAAAVLGPLLEHPAFLDHLAFLVLDEDQKAQVFANAKALIEAYPSTIDEFGALAAAICVVQDGGFSFRINENTEPGIDPVELFGYFSKNAGQLRHDPRTLPVELLVFVVDATGEIDDLRWALSNYPKNADIGERFFEIEYDYKYFREGGVKTVTASGNYCLPNIKRFGGVCADQAYFAAMVGKALGVPTTYVRARSATMSHAWIGFLHTSRRSAEWDLNSGRYPEYQVLRGSLIHPQTRQVISDNELSLIAGTALESQESRRLAAVGLGAAQRIAALRAAEGALPEAAPEGIHVGAARPRSVTIGEELDLLRAGLRNAPSKPAGWRHVVDHARNGDLAEKDLEAWFGVLDRLAGRDYPYFAAEKLLGMIAGLEDIEERHDACEWALKRYGRRMDLAAWIRLYQGRVWKAAGEHDKAWIAFDDSIKRLAATTPYFIDTLGEMEQMLEEAGKRREIAELYERAFTIAPKPRGSSVFNRQSNWYRSGKRAAQLWRSLGEGARASRIESALGK